MLYDVFEDGNAALKDEDAWEVEEEVDKEVDVDIEVEREVEVQDEGEVEDDEPGRANDDDTCDGNALELEVELEHFIGTGFPFVFATVPKNKN